MIERAVGSKVTHWELRQPVAPEIEKLILKLCAEWMGFAKRLKEGLGLGEGVTPLTCTQLLGHVYASKRDPRDDGLRKVIETLCGRPTVSMLSRWLKAIHGPAVKALVFGPRKVRMERISDHNTTRWFPSDEALRMREQKRGRKVLEEMAKRGVICMAPRGPEEDPKRARGIRESLRTQVRALGVAKVMRLTGAGRGNVEGWRDDALSRPITKADVERHIALHWSLDAKKALDRLLGEFMDVEALSGMLGVSKRKVARWQKTGEVPPDWKLGLEKLVERELGVLAREELKTLDLDDANDALDGSEVEGWFEG